MEVDMLSPSFRQMRSSKRMRSPPGSPTPLERPSKRTLFAPGYSATPSPIIQQDDLFGVLNKPPEDWVEKTDGLRIENASVNKDDAEQDGDDVSMNMDYDEEIASRPHIPLPRSRQQHGPSESQPEDAPPLICQQDWPSQQRTNCLQSNLFLSESHAYEDTLPTQNDSRAPPHINVIVPTPLDTPHLAQLGSSYPTSTTPHFFPTQDPSTGYRKQRFTMGPRSDCEKCRLGVKGHWAHYD